jgi:hypothetical protein
MVRGLDAVARSLDIDEDKIADALLKLESGQKINQEDYNIVNSVIDSLVEGAEAEAAPASEESDVDMLALKRKKLEQLLKGLE